MSDIPSMGSKVPYEPCPDCKPCDHVKQVTDLRPIDISLVTFTDEDIRQVAERANVTMERVRAYLKDEADQDDDLFSAFHWVTGCYPIGKFPRRDVGTPP